MIQQRCAICEKDNATLLYSANFDVKQLDARIFSARRLPDRIHYRMVRCNKCNLAYSTPILEYKKLEKLYKKSFMQYDEHLDNLKETYGHYLKEINKFRNESHMPVLTDLRAAPGSKHAQKDKERGIKNHQKLLEIGCGNGFFLEEAKQQGYDVYGVEPGVQSVKKARNDIRKHIKVDIFRPKLFKAGFFDVICCFQTFDHIPDPNGLLKECHRVLRKGGVILFFNHDIGALQNKLMGERSPIIDIEHTYLFDKKTMEMIFKKHKFNILEVKSAFNIHHLSYWLHLFPIPNSLKLPLIKFLNSTGIGKWKLKLNPGNLVLFAQK